MESLINSITSDSRTVISFCLIAASIRLYLDVIGFEFEKLPLSRALAKQYGIERVRKFHLTGRYLSIAQIVLFAPQFLLGQ